MRCPLRCLHRLEKQSRGSNVAASSHRCRLGRQSNLLALIMWCGKRRLCQRMREQAMVCPALTSLSAEGCAKEVQRPSCGCGTASACYPLQRRRIE